MGFCPGVKHSGVRPSVGGLPDLKVGGRGLQGGQYPLCPKGNRGTQIATRLVPAVVGCGGRSPAGLKKVS